jgi:competence protein ComEA
MNMDILKKLLLSIVLLIPLACFAAEAIDINVADQDELMTVKGIGEKRAAAIIAYREQHGRFNSIDELADVRGVSETFVEKSRAILTVKSEE